MFAQQQTNLAEKDFKITALTHELAYYRRIRYGKASEALAGEQRLLFDETVDTELLCHLAWNYVPDLIAVIGWSLWRRRHQALARVCHYKRRGRNIQL
ncbi:transposase [Massilia sp. DJPM01]|uniref:transposase n=1 Tax=Massilia sp. DJPM01 TaxID=3024404 RepID=UPI00259F5894|nr:transposase [Massilia sp. DJPM01]MDM5179160.1 transposase [Massilia sp. DJPM01]